MRALFPALLLALASTSQEVPDWAKRDYQAPPAIVFAAALKSIQAQKHDVKGSSEKTLTVDFHVGMTAWSWGYNMRLSITATDSARSHVTIGILKSGGSAFSWGSGDKEVRKIFAGIDAELASAAANPPTNEAPPATGALRSATVEVTSVPIGADVDLDGKFVGNTPTTLRLVPGDYTLVVKKAGYQPWTRTLTAIADNQAKISAELEKVN